MKPVAPIDFAPIPPAKPVAVVNPVWQPSRKWIVNLVGTIGAGVILATVRKYTGFDVQPVLDGIFAALSALSGQELAAPDAVATLSLAIGLALNYLVPVGVWDMIPRITNQMIELANLHNPKVTAVVTTPEVAERAAEITQVKVDAGLLPKV